VYVKAVKKSLVSVIVPSYNHGIYLPDAIDSVLNQTHSSVEVIVVDDGSTDNTREAAARYGDRVRYEYQSNQGLAAARNTGLRLVSGDFVVFLDADDLLLPTMMEQGLKRFEAQPDAGVVHCGWIYASTDLSDLSWRKTPTREGLLFKTFAHSIPLPCHSMLFRLPVLRKVGSFDATTGPSEDWDVWLRIARCGVRWASVKQPLVINRMHPVSMSRNSAVSFAAGKEVIRRAHAPDSRISNPYKDFALGCSCDASDALWNWLLNCLSFAIAQGQVDTSCALLEQEGPLIRTNAEPSDVARLVDCLWYSSATPRGRWDLLWPKVRKPLFDFLLRLEERSASVGFALQALSQIVPDEWAAPEAWPDALGGRRLLRALGRRIQSRVLGS
jgi:glycosyltransferase involved in cell wall biosynthesis